jgi:hypothetical protein
MGWGNTYDKDEWREELRFRLWNFKRGADVLLMLEIVMMAVRR